MDSIHTTDASPSAGATSGLIEGIGSPEAVQAHFKNTLLYSQSASPPSLLERPC